MNLSARVLCLSALCGASGGTFAAQDYAEVLGSTPVYSQVQVASPENRCVQQRVVDNSAAENNSAAGTLLGGVAGGVLGNAIGRGAGQALATVVGSVAGAVAGNQIAAAASPPPAEYTQQQCQLVTAYRTENRLDGYDVSYRYQGQIYHTRLRADPGPRLPVQVNVQPAVY